MTMRFVKGRMSRRRFLTGSALAGLGTGGLPLLARSGLAAPPIMKGTVLTVSTFGGVTQDAIKAYVQPEFEKLTGATIAYDVGSQGARYNKIVAQRRNPIVDAFIGGDELAVKGLQDGVFRPVSRKNVPNAADLFTGAMTVQPGITAETIGGFPYAVITYVLAYDPDVVKDKPTSWADLWRPEFAGKLAMASPQHSMMPAFVIIASELAGGSVDNVDPGFKKLADMRPSRLTMFWTDWAPMNKSGDVIAATEFDYYLETMKSQGYPIDYVVPKEKGIGAPQLVTALAGRPNPELTDAFIDTMLAPSVQEAVAINSFQGPTNMKAKLNADIAARISYGAKLADLRFFDAAFRVGVRPVWTERMNTEVAPHWQAR